MYVLNEWMNEQDFLRNMKNPTIDIMVKCRVYHQHRVEKWEWKKKMDVSKLNFEPYL